MKNTDVARAMTEAENQIERARNTIAREGRRILNEKNTDRRSQISQVRNATRKGREVTRQTGKMYQTSS